MTTLSVPLSDNLRSGIKNLVKAGVAPNEAVLARMAIQQYLEDKAVETVFKAQKEHSLSGNLDELAEKL